MSRVLHRFKRHASGYSGYSEKTANRIASESLSKPDIQSRIAELKAQRNDPVGINAR
ncbi:terminase small subunit [Klebsiella pneumoniae]|uniref:terminase small subunit n=1 Tax=Klebsiella pneumoniae complex TaxID=3390273 RepID=UPI0035A244D1